MLTLRLESPRPWMGRWSATARGKKCVTPSCSQPWRSWWPGRSAWHLRYSKAYANGWFFIVDVCSEALLSLQQTVCGFDLLRANGHSYVCDVNGFSFVKNSMKYYDDCAKILGYILSVDLNP